MYVPRFFSFTRLMPNGTTMKKMQNRIHAGTLCCTALGMMPSLPFWAIVSLKEMISPFSKPGSSPSSIWSMKTSYILDLHFGEELLNIGFYAVAEGLPGRRVEINRNLLRFPFLFFFGLDTIGIHYG